MRKFLGGGYLKAIEGTAKRNKKYEISRFSQISRIRHLNGSEPFSRHMILIRLRAYSHPSGIAKPSFFLKPYRKDFLSKPKKVLDSINVASVKISRYKKKSV